MSNHQQEASSEKQNETRVEGSQDVSKVLTTSSTFPLEDLSYGGLSDEDKIIHKRALRKLDYRSKHLEDSVIILRVLQKRTGDSIRLVADLLLPLLLLSSFDSLAIPSLLVLWLLSFIDRSSVGNAKIAGFATDLGLKGLQFSTGLAIFYVFYIAIELPSNLILRKVDANLFLPGIVVAWGIVTLCTAFTENYAGFVAVRAVPGLCEGPLLPGESSRN